MITDERREQARLDFSDVVTFEASAFMAAEASESPRKCQGRTTDVSGSGLSLVTQDEVLEDQILKINLPLPGVSVKTPTLVVVKWVRPENDGYKAGVMFVV